MAILVKTVAVNTTKDCGHGMRRWVVAEALLSDILSGAYRAGQRLVIKELSDRFNVSSTPIREALVQLEGVGIIEFAPNRGAIVRAVTVQDVREISSVRRVLECEATASAAGRINLTQLHDLAAKFSKMINAKRHGLSFVENARKFDSQLHDLIARSCDNRFLANEIERLKLLFRALRDASWETELAEDETYRFAEEAQEHLEIVEALITGDSDKASAAMSRHIAAGVKYWGRGFPIKQQ